MDPSASLQVDEATARNAVVAEESAAVIELLLPLLAHRPAPSESAELKRMRAQQEEWRSVVQQSRKALEADQERKFAALEEAKARAIADRDTQIESLRHVAASKETVIAGLYAQVAASGEAAEARLREQRQEMAMKHEELRVEAQRLAGHRERLRLEHAAAMYARDSQRALADSAVKRAAAVERDAWARQLRQLEAAEEAARSEVEAAAAESVEVLVAGFGVAHAALQSAEASAAARFRALRQEAKQAVEVSGADDPNDSPSESDDTDGDVGSAAAAHEAASRTIQHRARRQRRDAAAAASELEALRSAVAALESTVAQNETAMVLLREDADGRIATLQERCQRLAGRLEQADGVLRAAAGTRAKLRSEAHVLDSLIAEHDEEIAKLKAALAEQEAIARRYGRENKHEALTELERKHAALVTECDVAKRERTEAKARVRALEAAAQNESKGTSALTTENRALQRQLEELKRSHNSRAGTLAATAADATARANAAEARIELLERDLELRDGELAELRAEHATVRTRADKLRAQVADAEHRAGELDRARRLAISRELERRQQLREDRRVDAERRAAEEAADAARLEDEASLWGTSSGVPRDDTQQQQTAGNSAAAADLSASPQARVGIPAGADEAEFLTTDATIEALEDQLVLVKRERDTLRRQLTIALAEVSAAEERRTNTVQKYLALMNASDAAPRREMSLRQLEADLGKLEAALAARTDSLDQRELELKKREVAVTSKQSALAKQIRKLEAAHGSGGGAVMRLAGGGGGGMTVGSRSNAGDAASTASGFSSGAVMSPLVDTNPKRLAPLMHRPPHTQTPPQVAHPQLPPRASTPNPSTTASTPPASLAPLLSAQQQHQQQQSHHSH